MRLTVLPVTWFLQLLQKHTSGKERFARFLRFRIEPVLPSTLVPCSAEAGVSMANLQSVQSSRLAAPRADARSFPICISSHLATWYCKGLAYKV